MMNTLILFSKFLFFCLVILFYATVEASSMPREQPSAENFKFDLCYTFEVSDVPMFVTEFSENFFGSVVELFAPVSAYGEEVSSEKANDCCKCGVSEYVNKKLRQAITSFFFNTAAGIAIGVLILRLYYGSFY